MVIPAKHFYMIRHGQTIHNLQRLMAGHTDSPLTDLGRTQAKNARNIIAKLPDHKKPRIIIHSHLSRARDTATIINEALGVPMVEDPDVSEINCGSWEGVHWDDVGHLLDNWKNAPDGESADEFCARLIRAKKKALRDYEGSPLIVCHGGVFRAFGKMHDLHPPPRFKNAHLHEFEPDQSLEQFPWRVWTYGEDQDHFRMETRIFHDSPRFSSLQPPEETPAIAV